MGCCSSQLSQGHFGVSGVFSIIGICCAVINIAVICIYYTWGKVN
ncbi:hypothetical protein [Escherichia coli ISC7]|uniref:Uncharacterized protein n=1 Tax=Escherichia coli ISC7 TaxID=1432555 RepID=W1EVC6_ECOLX|nr:hypothetical protein [Escherichia coli ISC7]